MESNSSDFNPYQAPSVLPLDPALAPDVEFLFNDKVVAGVGQIVLPRICVVSGSTESLVARESRLWWCAQWLRMLRTILCLLAFVSGFPMLMHLPPGKTLTSPGPEIVLLLQVAVGWAIMAAAIASVAACLLFRRSVRVRWYLSQSVINRSWYLRLLGLFLGVITTSGIWFFVDGSVTGAMALTLLWIPVTLISLTLGKRILWVVGMHEELFLIGGLSEKFFTETQRLAAASAAKEIEFRNAITIRNTKTHEK